MICYSWWAHCIHPFKSYYLRHLVSSLYSLIQILSTKLIIIFTHSNDMICFSWWAQRQSFILFHIFTQSSTCMIHCFFRISLALALKEEFYVIIVSQQSLWIVTVVLTRQINNSCNNCHISTYPCPPDLLFSSVRCSIPHLTRRSIHPSWCYIHPRWHFFVYTWNCCD